MEFPVSSCPWDPDSWREAGVKLNCSRDNYGRILYQCAPNEGKSSLVEFCLRGSVARIEKGLCVDSLSNGYLGVQKCSQFDYGCPDESYINNEIYKYPACLEINTDEHCYVADPSCPRVRENSTDYFMIINGPTTATALQMATNALAAFGYAILVLGILLGLILFFKRRGHIYKRVSTDEETPADDLDGEVIARDIEEYGIDFILKCPFKKEQHDKIAKKLRIPIEILSWSKDDKEKFVRDLREGETRVYHGRCMVVGSGGVGKTTLVNNLRGVYDEEPASTVGLDCHPNVFKVDDKKGLIVATDEEKSSQCTQICMKNLDTKADVTQEKQNNLESRPLDNRSIDSDHEINDNGESSEVYSETRNIESNESIADIEIFEKSQKLSIQMESNELQKKELNPEHSDQIQKKDGSGNAEEQIVIGIQSESEDIVQDIIQPVTEENARIEKGKVETDIIPVESVENKKLSIMDFAGQSVYYACHHIYYSPRAFFILVMDMSKNLNEKPKDSSLSHDLMYSGWSNLDFMRYWLGSIHTYSSSDVPVILVASHSENISEKKSEYYEKIKRNLPEDLLKHLSLDRLFKVKKMKDENIEKIKMCIGGILKEQLHWGERIPTSWVSLEQIITRRKDSVKVWKTNELWEYVNGNENCRIKRKDDLLTALNFFNDIGVILFKPQGKLGESIILDVQWFVDAFKCIITDKEHQPMINRPNHDWEYFDSTGILQKKLLEDTWKDSPFFKHKEGLILHMSNLGMMAVFSDEEYYVPCMNKQHYNPAILEGFNMSSTLCFMFQYLPLVIFHRLVATCMQKFQWRIWKGNRTKTRVSDSQLKTNTDYCIYHTATIFENGVYKILIGINDLKPFGDKDRIPYLIELQIITVPDRKIELSKSREIREKVEDTLLELMSCYPAVYGDSDAYKTGYRCSKSPFGTINSHKIFTFEPDREGSLVQECIDCKREIDFEELISYWTKTQQVIEEHVGFSLSPLKSSILCTILMSENYEINTNTLKEANQKVTKAFPSLYHDELESLSDTVEQMEKTDKTVTVINGSNAIAFISEDVRHQVMDYFKEKCLKTDNDFERYIKLSSVDSLIEYVRIRGYMKNRDERCLYLPEKMEDAFIRELGIDAIRHVMMEGSFHRYEHMQRIRRKIQLTLNVPEEVLSWDFKARCRYVECAKRGTQTIHSARAIIIGCAGAGKTTLLKRLQKRSLEQFMYEEYTVGLDIHENIFEISEDNHSLRDLPENIDVGGKQLLSVVDFAGQCAYYACHQVYLSRRAFYILVIDMSKSFDEKIDPVLCEQQGTMFADWTYGEYLLFWLKSVHTYCDKNAPVVIVGTHLDKVKGQSSDRFFNKILDHLRSTNI